MLVSLRLSPLSTARNGGTLDFVEIRAFGDPLLT